MKYISEFRDPELATALLKEINNTITQPWVIMEICGGQTHSIMKHGLDQLLPDLIELVHGPGCPVCVTSLELIDKALAIASMENVIFTSFGDMLRVPGSEVDLFSVRAAGGSVRVVYSPLDALKIAEENPDKEVVFFAIGFETTAPANAMAVYQAKKLAISNFSILVSHVRVPPAISTILSSELNRVNGFLTAGHVSTVMGYWEYEELCKKHQTPMVVTGFEPLDLLQGILMLVKQLENKTFTIENAYPRVVSRNGNQEAQNLINKVLVECDRNWRGFGMIPASGWCLHPDFLQFDAEKKFSVENISPQESAICIAGEILQGLKKPHECPAFAKECTPVNPLGATMVSSEGACAAYYKYALHEL